jgi:hypothetical protein
VARKAQEKEEHKQRSMEGQRARNERDAQVFWTMINGFIVSFLLG